MNEEDLKIVRELFDKARENFERDGYLAPALFAWASVALRQSTSLRATSVPSC